MTNFQLFFKSLKINKEVQVPFSETEVAAVLKALEEVSDFESARNKLMIELSQNQGPKILVVLHQATSTPGRVGQLLVKMGFALDIRRPPLGDELPTTLKDHAGAVVFGGPMSANDDFEYVGREINWLDIQRKEKGRRKKMLSCY